MKSANNSFCDTAIVILTVLTIFVSNFYFSRALVDQFRFPKLAVQLIFLWIIIAVFAACRFTSLGTVFRNRLFYLIYLFLAGALLSHIINKSGRDGVFFLIIAFTHCLFLIALGTVLRKNSHFIPLIITAMIVVSLLVSVWALIQVLNMDPVFKISGERLEYYRVTRFAPTGFTGNTNVFSGTMLSAVPLIFCLLLYARGKFRLILWLSAGIIIAPLAVSMTRGVLAGVIISLIYAVIKKKHTKTAVILSIVLLTAFSVFFVSFESRVRERLESTLTLKELSIQYRLKIYEISFSIIRDHPLFGTGPNSFYRVFSHYKYLHLDKNPCLHDDSTFISLSRSFPEQAHNDILQNITELGIIPNFFALIFLMAMIIKNNKIFTDKSVRILYADIPENTLKGFLKLSVIIFLINALFNFPFHFATSGLNFIITLSLLYSLSYKKIDKS